MGVPPLLAGMFQIVGVIGLELSAKNPTWTHQLMLYGGFMISFHLLVSALSELPVSLAYPVWTGIGTIGTAIVGMLLFREPIHRFRIAFIIGIAACVAGLHILE